MKPSAAMALVGRYARLTRAIKDCKKRIGAELDKCTGLRGHRNETVRVEAFAGINGDLIEAYDEPTERANQDQETHLVGWYQKPGRDDDWGNYRRHVIGDDERAECPHCYEAHLIVQERKELRRQLGHVKAAMTRFG